MLLGGLVAVIIIIVLLASARRSSRPPEQADEDWFLDEYLPLDPDLDGRIDN